MTGGPPHPDAGQPPISDRDAALLAELGRIAGLVDPVPDDLVVAGKGLFALRDPLAVLMETLSDAQSESELGSADEDAQAGGLLAVRGGGAATSRMHFFEYGDVSIDLEVSAEQGSVTVLGVVLLADADASEDLAGRVAVETPAASFETALGEEGRFTFTQVPAGMLRLQVELPGHPRLTTRWVETD